jgi:cytochrome c biogenesis protein ResB
MHQALPTYHYLDNSPKPFCTHSQESFLATCSHVWLQEVDSYFATWYMLIVHIVASLVACSPSKTHAYQNPLKRGSTGGAMQPNETRAGIVRFQTSMPCHV